MAAQLTGPNPMASSLSSSILDDDYPLVGETLGLWRLTRGIGRGGMGEVYEGEYDFLHLLTLQYGPQERIAVRQELESLPRAEQALMGSELLGTDMQADARFAIKVCTARIGTASHKRFLQEAGWAKNLGAHPYIVTVHSVNAGSKGDDDLRSSLPLDRGKHRDVAYMVMDIAECSFDPTRLTINEAVHAIRCVASALDHAHANGIVHRDLKPENILSDVEHPLLTDFGIAKEVEQTHGLTRTGQIIGTLDYMSPEQATDAKHVDLRTDVYSLGVVLYEFATNGSLPYYHLTDRESCLAGIRTERIEPRWPRQYVANFPRALEWIILKAMAHRPEDRYQTMSDFIADLDRYTRGAWIPFWGHVRVKRFINFTKQSRPRVFWGVPIVLAMCLMIWGVFALRQSMDTVGNTMRENLLVLEQTAHDIKVHNRQLLNAEERDVFNQLQGALDIYGKDYPESAARFETLQTEINQRQYLDVHFDSERSDDTRRASKQRLIMANGVQGSEISSAWNMVEFGLGINSDQQWVLAPYGKGVTYSFFEGYVRPPFQLSISENERSNHSCLLRYLDGKIELVYKRDEMSERILWSKSAVSRRGFSFKGGLIVDANELILIWPSETQRFQLPALRQGAASKVEISLSSGSVLERFYIGLKKPKIKAKR